MTDTYTPVEAAMMLTPICVGLRRLLRDRRGNVLMIMGFAIIPITFSTGMAVDYVRAARLQTKLNAVADAAALSAVTTPMMSKTNADGCFSARTLFVSQVNGIKGLTINVLDPAQLVITVTDNANSGNCSASKGTTSTSYSRTATVTWKALSQNSFAGILGMQALAIGGTSQSTATVAPNIDYYIVLDTSGSMALPVTSSDIATLKSATGGCAFACHSTNDATARGKDGKVTDYYGVARSYNMKLRIDEEGSATQSMMSTAKAAMKTSNAIYRMSISRFGEKGSYAGRSWENIFKLDKDLDAAGAKAKTVQTSTYYKNSYPEQNRWNNDTDTAPSDAFDKMYALMPQPGQGSNAPSDTPQQVMLVITDGMRDENRGDGRPEVAFDTAKCDAIKLRGTRIAILYTEYLQDAINNDTWSVDPNQGNVLNRLWTIEPALQNCASPGLYTKVTTDGDINAALTNLFKQTVATARLTN